MQFSVVALSLASVSAVLAADAISQIGDGQVQATSAPATKSSATSAPATSAPATSAAPSSTGQILTQTANGANQLAGGAAVAGLVAAGALLI